MPSLARPARVQYNRLATIAVLAVALPSVIVAGTVSQPMAAALSRWWIRVGGRLTGVRFEHVGALISPTTKPQILVANHSSLLDAAAVLAVHPRVRFVAGADLFRIPLLAGALRAVGAVPVDRRSGSGGHLHVPQLAAGNNWGPLVIFPEGRIAPVGQPLPFRRGAFALAIESGADVIPIAIHHSARSLPPGGRFGVVPGTVTVEYCPKLSTGGLVPADRYQLCEHARRAILEALEAGDDGGATVDATLPDPLRA